MELIGSGITDGIAIGSVYKYSPTEVHIEHTTLKPEEIASAISDYQGAQKAAYEELELLHKTMSLTAPDKAEIFAAHMDIVTDEEINEQILSAIRESHMNVLWAVSSIYNEMERTLAGAGDPTIRERSADIADVCQRLLRLLSGKTCASLADLPFPCILVAFDLFPSDAAAIDKTNLLGMITEQGGITSHTAIIAKTYGIPAVLGVSGIMSAVENGDTVILDAGENKVFISPEENTLLHYRKKQGEYLRRKELLEKYRLAASETMDGVHIDIGVNLASVRPEALACEPLTDFVGLLRTEFLYLERDSLPDEEEQFQQYKTVACTWGEKPVELRTLDIGGDKQLPYLELPREDNPFLGVRALRLCFARKELFRTQLRAAIRASHYGHLQLMLPMVSSIEDIRRAKREIEDVKEELRREGFPFNQALEIGVMIEIPALAQIADLVAQEVDFASIGTNDLCQYATASDRTNPGVSSYYQNFHPGLLRLLKNTIDGFKTAGTPISVCGEMGGNKLAIPLLVGFGLRMLSMNSASIPEAKYILSLYTIKEMEAMADHVLRMRTADEVQMYLSEILVKKKDSVEK